MFKYFFFTTIPLLIIFYTLSLVYPSNLQAHKGHTHITDDLTDIQNLINEQQKFLDGADRLVTEVEKRKKWAIFVIGSDYEKISELKTKIAENNQKLEKIDNLLETVGNEAEKEKYTIALNEIRDFNGQLEENIRSQQERFSLLGWLFRWFEKK